MLQLLEVASSIDSIGFAFSVLIVIDLWVVVQCWASHGYSLRPMDLSKVFDLRSISVAEGAPGIPLSEQSLPGITPRSPAATLRCNLGVTPSLRYKKQGTRCLFVSVGTGVHRSPLH